MAFNTEEDAEGINDINITPFVDVVLVLLVIFMVTAPMMMKDVIDMRLPPAQTSDQTEISSLGITILKAGQVLINGVPSTWESLALEATQIAQTSPKTQVIIAADLDTRHANVVRAIDIVRKAGLFDFALQVERQNERPNKSPNERPDD